MMNSFPWVHIIFSIVCFSVVNELNEMRVLKVIIINSFKSFATNCVRLHAGLL